MPIFKYSAYPAARTDHGSTEIVVTNCLKRGTFECTVPELIERLKTEAVGINNTEASHPLIIMYGDPAARAPNGWKKIEAAHGNRVLIDTVAAIAR